LKEEDKMSFEPMRKKVLLVDDDTSFASDLKTWLSREGFCVHVAQVGRAAIQFYNLYRPYAAVVLDLHMPKVDGYQVFREIKKADATCKVAMLTADATAYNRAMSLGPDAFLLKPVGRQAICELICRLTCNPEGAVV